MFSLVVLFSLLQIVLNQDFTCPTITPTGQCPTGVELNKRLYTADYMPNPIAVPGMINRDPMCLQNYTLHRSDGRDYKLTCHKPGPKFNQTDPNKNRYLMVIQSGGKYHLTRSISCSDRAQAHDEGGDYKIPFDATFTCIDRLPQYDALIKSMGYDVTTADMII